MERARASPRWRVCAGRRRPFAVAACARPSCPHFLSAHSSRWLAWETFRVGPASPRHHPPATNFSGRKPLEAEQSAAPAAVSPNPWSARPGCVRRTPRGGAVLKLATLKCLSGMQIIILSLKDSEPQRPRNSDLPLPKRIARACQKRAQARRWGAGTLQRPETRVHSAPHCLPVASELLTKHWLFHLPVNGLSPLWSSKALLPRPAFVFSWRWCSPRGFPPFC